MIDLIQEDDLEVKDTAAGILGIIDTSLNGLYSIHIRWMDRWMDGWMNCNFTSSLTVFQSYQDDGWVIMKSCVPWNPIYN